MRRILIAAALAMLGASPALAQDAAPPGCRWMGDGNLACKDGKGYWRRSGDGEIVGTYSVAKPKPKPKPQPAPAVAAAPVAAPAPIAAPTPAPVTAPAPPPVVAPAPVQAEAPPLAPAVEPAQPTVETAQVEPPKSWWRRWLDSVWRDIQALLRLFGIGK